MSNPKTRTHAAVCLILLTTFAAAVPAFARQRISAELETSRLSLANGVADVTFKVVVKNDEADTLAGVFLVFDDGFEVAVGDVNGEASGSSASTTRTFDLSGQPDTLNVGLPATLKYSVDGAPVEQAISVTLRLQQ